MVSSLPRTNRPDGRKYDGEWLDGKQHGTGTFISAVGVNKIALWSEGKVVRWIQTPKKQSSKIAFTS